MLKKLLVLTALCASAAFAQGNSCASGNVGHAIVTISTSGTTTVIPAVSGASIHICTVSVAFASGVGMTLVAVNTGGNTNLTGTYPNVGGFGQGFNGELFTGLGNGLGINITSAVAGGGVITYYLSRTN